MNSSGMPGIRYTLNNWSLSSAGNLEQNSIYYFFSVFFYFRHKTACPLLVLRTICMSEFTILSDENFIGYTIIVFQYIHQPISNKISSQKGQCEWFKCCSVYPPKLLLLMFHLFLVIYCQIKSNAICNTNMLHMRLKKSNDEIKRTLHNLTNLKSNASNICTFDTNSIV